MSHVTAARIPTPILFYILRFAATGFLEPLPVHAWFQESFADQNPTSTLFSAAVVNKHWSSVATDVLYESIKIEDEKRTNLKSVWTTLYESPSLASLVRRLDFGTPAYHGEDAHIQIISVCPNLTHLKFNSFRKSYVPVLQLALSRKVLKSLYISPYDVKDRTKGLFCTLEEVLDVVKGWRHLESVYIANGAVFPSFNGQIRPTVVIPGLKTMALECQLPGLSTTVLQYAKHVAPNLEKFELIHSRFVDGIAMSQALERWSDTLTDLDLRCYSDTDFAQDAEKWEYVAAALPALHCLRHLNLGVSFPEASFVTAIPTRLETLGVVITTPRALIRAFQGPQPVPAPFEVPKFLPKLKILRVWRFGKESLKFSEELAVLTMLCNERGVGIRSITDS